MRTAIINNEIKELVESELKKLEKIAKESYCIDLTLGDDYFVEYEILENKLGYQHCNVLHFDIELLEENPKLYIDNVVRHEFVHLIQREIYGGFAFIQSHGKEFREICRVFGFSKDISRAKTKVFNDSKILQERLSKKTKRKQKRYEYICEKCGTTYQLSTTRHNRILKGVTYFCSSSFCKNGKRKIVEKLK